MINCFEGYYGWLSNFWPCQVFYEGHIFPSSENAYQAAKVYPEQRIPFLTCSATRSKILGRQGQIRNDWEQVKESIMLEVLQNKFAPTTRLCDKLIMTEGHDLVEGNFWNDTYWGVCKGIGQNRLGVLLMQVRQERLNAR